jgi:hypothetical protein
VKLASFNGLMATHSRRPWKRTFKCDSNVSKTLKSINSVDKLDYFYIKNNNFSGFINNKLHCNDCVTNLDYFFDVQYDSISEHCSQLDYYSDVNCFRGETQPSVAELDNREVNASNYTHNCFHSDMNEMDELCLCKFNNCKFNTLNIACMDYFDANGSINYSNNSKVYNDQSIPCFNTENV